MSARNPLKEKIERLKLETYAVYLAYRDPRVRWYAKAFAACVVAYALSPIDLIPDFIPVIGYLDDIIIVPLGLALAVRMIPPAVLDECREQARERMAEGMPTSRAAAVVVLGIWLLLAALAAYLVIELT